VVLTLQEADEGGYIVTSPLSGLITEAETVSEAFANARVLSALRESRAKLLRRT
jgi:predicted RNase H-like HicB family nuclease